VTKRFNGCPWVLGQLAVPSGCRCHQTLTKNSFLFVRDWKSFRRGT
jgi:hypothetical protein